MWNISLTIHKFSKTEYLYVTEECEFTHKNDSKKLF